MRVDFEDYQDDDSFFFGRFLASEQQGEVLWSAQDVEVKEKRSIGSGARVQGMLALNGLPEVSLQLRRAVSLGV